MTVDESARLVSSESRSIVMNAYDEAICSTRSASLVFKNQGISERPTLLQTRQTIAPTALAVIMLSAESPTLPACIVIAKAPLSHRQASVHGFFYDCFPRSRARHAMSKPSICSNSGLPPSHLLVLRPSQRTHGLAVIPGLTRHERASRASASSAFGELVQVCQSLQTSQESTAFVPQSSS